MPTSAKFFRMCFNNTENGAAPFGDGAIIIELPVLSAFIMLLVGVASGLVDGTIAAITPLGRNKQIILSHHRHRYAEDFMFFKVP